MTKKEKLIIRAQKYIQKGYLDRAIEEYKNVAAMDPTDISIRLRLGDLYVKTGNKEEAIKEYTDVAKFNTHKGFYLKAIAVYKQILKLDETTLDIHYKLADLYTKQRLIADAINEYSFILNNFEKKDKTTDALELLLKMVEIDPENVGVKLKLADLHQRLGFEKDALMEYSWVFERLVSQGKLDKAEQIYLGVYKNYSKEPKVLEGLAELYKKKGDNEQFAKYGGVLANIYKDSGEFEKVKALCEAILKVRPDDVKALAIISELKLADIGSAAEEPGGGATPPETDEEVEAEEKEVEGEVAGGEAPGSRPEVGEEVATEAEAKEVTEVAQSPEAKAPGGGPEEVGLEGTEQGEEEEFVEVDVPLEGGQQPEEIEEEKVEKEPEEIQELEAVESIEEIEEVEAVVEEASPEEMLEEATEPFVEPIEEVKEEEKVEKEVEAGEGGISGEVDEVSPEELPEGFPEAEETVEAQEEAHEEDYVDLSRELGLEEALDSMVRPWSKGERGEAVDEFKDSMGRQLSKEDSETHHNLGIAYMEMELYDDAVREFKIALKDPAFEFDSYTRLGLCSMARGSTDDAIEYFLKALQVKGRTDDERKGIMYELGLAYEAADKTLDAGEMYGAVYDMDPRYREVSEKVKEYEAPRLSIPRDDSLVEVEIL
jgi:tetratricopeptide (TPR) repeat protein